MGIIAPVICFRFRICIIYYHYHLLWLAC